MHESAVSCESSGLTSGHQESLGFSHIAVSGVHCLHLLNKNELQNVQT